MIPAALPVLFEAVLRALIAACVLGVVLRLLRVRNVPAQKAAWGLVLMAALAMPLLMRWQWVPAWAEVKLPTAHWRTMTAAAPVAATASPAPVSQPPEPAANPQSVSPAEDRYDLPAISDSDFSAPVSAPAEVTPTPASPSATPVNKPAAKIDLARLFSLGWLVYLAVCVALLLRLLLALAASIRLVLRAKPIDVVPSQLNFRATSMCVPAGASPHRSTSARSFCFLLTTSTGTMKRCAWCWPTSTPTFSSAITICNLLAGLYTAITWFSPLGWWLKRKLSELAEAISDHAGLQAAASPAAYAELLLEFAALPRPTLSGVAMARSTNLSQRIERLLNETSFRQTFAGGRRVLVTLMVPAVLIAAASLVRVQAADVPGQTAVVSNQVAAPQPATAPGRPSVPSLPAITVQPAHSPTLLRARPRGFKAQFQDCRAASLSSSAPAPVPVATQAPEAAPMAPAAPTPAASDQQPAAPASPAPHVHVDVHVPPMHVQVEVPPMPPMPRMENFKGPRIDFRSDETTYAVIGDPGAKTQFHGDWDVNRGEEVEKARKLAQGHFILFRRDGKSYIIDDPTIVSQVEAMDKALQAQSEQMRALSKQMRDAVEPFRDQMHDQQQQERDAERKARETASEIPTPDITKEMAELNAAVAALQAKQGGTISREQLSEIERKIGEVQRRVIEAQVRMKVNVDFDMSKFNEARSKFSEQQSQYGAQMGQLGSQIGQVAHENNEKIKSIVNDSLSNGKARPVN